MQSTNNNQKSENKPDPLDMKMIKVAVEVHKELYELKRYQENYNDVIKRLIDFYKENINQEEK